MTFAKEQFPSFIQIIKSVPSLVMLKLEGKTTVFSALGITIWRVIISMFWSLWIGLIFGYILGRYEALWSLIQPSADFLRSIPVTFLLPVAALVSGSLNKKLPAVLALIPCSLIMILQIRVGVQRISADRRHAFRVLAGNTRAWYSFRYLILPEIAPEIFSGLRLCASYSLVIISVLEYMNVGSQHRGFGLFVNQLTQNVIDYPKLFAAILLFGVIGYSFNKMLELVGNNYSRWRDVRSND
jgi:NitT/TauT family transport system permease protein